MGTVIFDGNYLANRSCKTPNSSELRTTEGLSVGPLLLSLRTVQKTLDKFDATRCIVAWDKGHSQRRKALLPEYKKKDKEPEVMPDGTLYSVYLREQVKLFTDFTANVGIRHVSLPGREGDDIISALCPRLGENPVIVSDDRDMLLLLNQYDISVFRIMANEVLDRGNFQQRMGLPYQNYIYYKCTLGDNSDNIKGVHGVGEKTLDALLSGKPIKSLEEYASYVSYAISINRFPKAITTKLRKILQQFDVVVRNYKLMNMDLETFTEQEIQQVMQAIVAPIKLVEESTVLSLMKDYQMKSLLQFFTDWITPFRRLK